MSKSAIFSIVLGLLAIAFLNRRQLSRVALGLAGFVGSITVILVMNDGLRHRALVPLASFGFSSSVVSYDYSVLDSIRYRLVDLPLENIQGLVEARQSGRLRCRRWIRHGQHGVGS